MTFQLAQDTRTTLFRPKQDMGLKLVLRSITYAIAVFVFNSIAPVVSRNNKGSWAGRSHIYGRFPVPVSSSYLGWVDPVRKGRGK